MKQKLKNQKGVAFIAVILVIVIAVAAGGASYLGVRMLVTGEHFLTPFEELGWIDLEENEDNNEEKENKDKESNEDDKKDEVIEEDKEESDSKDVGSVKKDRLSEEAKKSDVDHYYGSMTMADTEEYDSTDEMAELYELLTLEVNLYARNDQVVEIVFSINMKEYLEKSYELYKDDFVAAGYETYEEFEEEMIPMLESAFDFGFSSVADESNEEVFDYIEKYNDNGNLQIYITEEGFDSLYETYNIEDGEANVETFCDALEESMGIKINKV